jgi:GMP synthase (glutamine-hydrolysing)
MHSKILILDFGSQFTQLIARRVREIGIFSEVYPYDVPEDFIQNYNAAGIILSGGPNSVVKFGNMPRAPQSVFELGIPILAICYGMQTMAEQLGGKVEVGQVREFGYAEVCTHSQTALLEGIADFLTHDSNSILKVWMSHGDRVVHLPPDFKIMASTPDCPIAGMADEKRKFYAVQFHPEVTHTMQGKTILNRFVTDICCCESNWNMPNYIDKTIRSIRDQVGKDEVILGLSGGVDSSVAAVLIHRAIGSQLTCIFVDHGMLRLGEAKVVTDMFAKNLGVRVIHINATTQFMNCLDGVTDPESKRKAIGHEFVKVFQQESKKLSSPRWLAQGTIYPDVIESSGKDKPNSHTIKSHHNVGGIPKDLDLKLLEPLRELFKDEVRKLGIELGLPDTMLYRHPFPGPGLGIRVLGEIKKEFVEILRLADAIFTEELRNTADDQGNSWYDKVGQAFAVFLPIKSVGVMGDCRTYEYVIALRAVQTDDFMTAHWAHLPYEMLARVSSRIINEVRGINRVVYDISGKPPSTIEWE